MGTSLIQSQLTMIVFLERKTIRSLSLPWQDFSKTWVTMTNAPLTATGF